MSSYVTYSNKVNPVTLAVPPVEFSNCRVPPLKVPPVTYTLVRPVIVTDVSSELLSVKSPVPAS